MVNLDIDMELLAKYAYLIQGQMASKGTENAQRTQHQEPDHRLHPDELQVGPGNLHRQRLDHG